MQLLLVLRHGDAGSLLLHAQIGDALAQRLQTAINLHAALVAGTQFLAQVFVFAAPRSQHRFKFQLLCQGLLQQFVHAVIAAGGQGLLGLLRFALQIAQLLRCQLQIALQLLQLGLQGFDGKFGFFGLVFNVALA